MGTEGLRAWAPIHSVSPIPPECGAVIARSRLTAIISEALFRFPLVVLAAPAGYGKTTAVRAWSEADGRPVVWYSARATDGVREEFLHALLWTVRQALPGLRNATYQTVANGYGAEVGSRWAEEVADEVRSRLTEHGAVLVLDDAHEAPPDVLDAVIGGIVGIVGEDQTAPRLVLVTRAATGSVARLIDGSASVLGAAELSFTPRDVAHAIEMLHGRVDQNLADRVGRMSLGWPLAVRALLLGGPNPTWAPVDGETVLAESLRRGLIERLEPDEQAFVLSATMLDELDGLTATALTGLTDSAARLDNAFNRGLYLVRFPGLQRSRYRWHPLFASACRRILTEADPARAAELELRAVELRERESPIAAAELALAMQRGDLVERVVQANWLPLLLDEHAETIDSLILRLPSERVQRPELLRIRACCAEVRGDRAGAVALRLQADRFSSARSEGSNATPDRPTTTVVPLGRLFEDVAALLLLDDAADLAGALDRLDHGGAEQLAADPRVTAALTFLRGWTELRLRRRPARAVALLTSAAAAGRAYGLTRVTRRAEANLAFALALAGRLTEALTAARPSVGSGEPAEDWATFDLGLEEMTHAFVAYWRDEREESIEGFSRAAMLGGGTTYASMARIFLALALADEGADARMRDVEQLLAVVPTAEAHGVPWPVLSLLARARLAEARGQTAEARRAATTVAEREGIPLALISVAAMLARLGEMRGAANALDRIRPREVTPIVKTSALATLSVVASASRREAEAHARLEQALNAAATERILRPFTSQDEVLRGLLDSHAAFGTAHELLLMDIARRIVDPRSGLTEREREILGYLRTTMTVAEIATRLQLSVNTVKTHQRSIYRKLGVNDRRSAVLAARSPR